MSNKYDNMNALPDPYIRKVTAEILRIEKLTTTELADEIEQLTGQRPKVNNHQTLKRQLAHTIQVKLKGDLGEVAIAKIEELAQGGIVPDRLRRRIDERRQQAEGPPAPPRDPRLPPPGTKLTKRYKGADYVITVHESTFEWNGATYENLTRLALAITKKHVSGFAFFGLSEAWQAPAKGRKAKEGKR